MIGKVFRRLPTYFPNFRIQMMPLTVQELEKVKSTGWLPVVPFRVPPNYTKIEIKRFLESVYKMKVDRVNTVNYDGKRKMTKYGMTQRAAYKKAYVYLAPLEKQPFHQSDSEKEKK